MGTFSDGALSDVTVQIILVQYYYDRTNQSVDSLCLCNILLAL